MNATAIILSYFAILNIITIAVYGWDKYCAKHHKWRTPESTLLLFAVLGGSIGALLAMKLFHHKTLHLKFKYGVPLILVLQIVGLVYVWLK